MRLLRKKTGVYLAFASRCVFFSVPEQSHRHCASRQLLLSRRCPWRRAACTISSTTSSTFHLLWAPWLCNIGTLLSPFSCPFLQWAINEGFHCSGLYLPLLREHTRPGVNLPLPPRRGFWQEHLAQAPQITVHPLDTLRAWPWPPAPTLTTRSSSNAWATSIGLNTKRTSSKSSTCRSGVCCVVVCWLRRELSTSGFNFFTIRCALPEVILQARTVNGFRVIGHIESPPIFRRHGQKQRQCRFFGASNQGDSTPESGPCRAQVRSERPPQ